MKVEEIKLAFETNVQLALIDDLKVSADSLNSEVFQYNKILDIIEQNQREAQNKKGILFSKKRELEIIMSKIKNLSEQLGQPIAELNKYNPLFKDVDTLEKRHIKLIK